MRNVLYILMFTLLLGTGMSIAAGGSGQVRLGYTYIDEEGNQSVNQTTFNQYEGVGLSLEKFRYRFDNGIRLKADLKSITLNNRNMVFGIEKSGLFGVRGYNNQYRRAYDFDGASKTRRHRTGAKLWVYPHKFVKIYGGGDYTGKSGRMEPLFDLAGVTGSQMIDYNQFCYHGGIRLNRHDGMFQAEYRAGNYNDDIDPDRDQSRFRFSMHGLLPVPGYDWLVLTGWFYRFETKYDLDDFEINTNYFRGGARAKLPSNFDLNYYFLFDRTRSDSDVVATDNLAHTFYVSHIWPGLAGLTAGYQYGINDDFEDDVRSNAFYFYGWFRAGEFFEFRGEHGFRSEDVNDGARLIGDEDRFRFKFSARYKRPECGSITFRYEGKSRENDQIGSEIDFSRIGTDVETVLRNYGNFTAGYSYSRGEYENTEGQFEFADHVLYGDITTREYKGFDAGFGATYYRSKRDLDVESFTLRFRAGYRFMDDHRIDIKYNVDNFDDFLVRDKYYTSNIVEISLTKILSF